MQGGRVSSLSRSPAHGFSKQVCDEIALIAGLGVAGDAHCGETVKHRSRVAVDPAQPNLRQVHLIPSELFVDLKAQGFELRPGYLGENILTIGLDLFGMPQGTRMRIGADAEIEITGLRNPCAQIEAFMPGLLSRMVSKASDGAVVRRAGVMAIVLVGGRVSVGDPIAVELPPLPHNALERV